MSAPIYKLTFSMSAFALLLQQHATLPDAAAIYATIEAHLRLSPFLRNVRFPYVQKLFTTSNDVPATVTPLHLDEIVQQLIRHVEPK
jgi:hypothetical protein